MKFTGTDSYVTTDDLNMAVNAAVALERPLLVKGEPGTGKTQLAYEVAQSLGRPLLTTSAIPDGEEQACEDADELMEAFGRYADVIIDSGPLINEPSTVIEIIDEAIEIVRVGAGPVDDILAD